MEKSIYSLVGDINGIRIQAVDFFEGDAFAILDIAYMEDGRPTMALRCFNGAAIDATDPRIAKFKNSLPQILCSNQLMTKIKIFIPERTE